MGQIKEELLNLVILEKDWNRWWQSARSKLKKDTKVHTPSQIKEPFILLEKEMSFEKALQEALDKKPEVDEIIQMVYTFVRDFPQTLKEAHFKKTLEEKLLDVLQEPTLEDPLTIQIYYFLHYCVT